MVDKKIKDFTKGIEEIAKLHPADRKKVFSNGCRSKRCRRCWIR